MLKEIRDARKTIVEVRTERGMSVEDAARALQISARLLEAIEDGSYTHPKIAMRIQALFRLQPSEARQLVNPKHEPVQHPKWGHRNNTSTKAEDDSIEYWNYKSQKYKGKIKRGVFGV